MNIAAIRENRAKALKKLRKEAKMTQKQVREKSTLSRMTVTNIERGTRQWGIDSEILYMEALKK